MPKRKQKQSHGKGYKKTKASNGEWCNYTCDFAISKPRKIKLKDMPNNLSGKIK